MCVMPVVLYGCEACSVTLMEDRMLRIFGNGHWGRSLGMRDRNVTGYWRRLHNEEHNDL